VFAWLQERPLPAPAAGTPPRLLALGDPRFLERAAPPAALPVTRDRFVPLPGSRREVTALAALFAQSEKLLGSDASEQKLDELAAKGCLKEFRYLHLATHGHADARNGLRSYLALAQDRLPDRWAPLPAGRRLHDGKLTAGRLLQHWELEADLVTLSACESGLGQQQGGEGYVGFAQALFLAGARSLVLSQWKVDDQATALLMVRFYQNLLGKRPGLERPLGKTAALAEAKRWLRQLPADEAGQLAKQLVRGEDVPFSGPMIMGRPFEHPYFWAGFILIGDPGDVSQAVPVLAEPASVAGTPVEPAADSADWRWTAAGVVSSGILAAAIVLGWRRRRNS
jgi:CHAT domain-containing protein